MLFVVPVFRALQKMLRATARDRVGRYIPHPCTPSRRQGAFQRARHSSLSNAIGKWAGATRKTCPRSCSNVGANASRVASWLAIARRRQARRISRQAKVSTQTHDGG
jgi:hypothetical protein